MSTEQHNFNAKCKRRAFQVSFNQSEGKANGKADAMLPAIDWRKTFKKWGVCAVFGLSGVFRKGKPFADTEEKRDMLDSLVGEFARKPRWRMTNDGSVSNKAIKAITDKGSVISCENGVCYFPIPERFIGPLSRLEEMYGNVIAYTEDVV